MRKKIYYAIYKGDKFIDLGTKEYLANIMKCKTRYIEYLATPARKRKIDKSKKGYENSLISIRIEDD